MRRVKPICRLSLLATFSRGWGLLGLLLALWIPLNGQTVPNPSEGEEEVKNPWVVGLRGHYGFVLLHSQSVAPIGQSYPWGIEADFSKHLVGKKAWEFCNCYPRVGTALTYWNFDNPEVLGHGLTFVPYIEPIWLTRYKVNFSWRIGMGVSYQSRPYDPVTNPLNLSYSTRFAFPLMMNLGLNYRVNEEWNTRFTLDYNHISNGGIRLPNKGINYPTAGLGMDYTLSHVNFQERDRFRKPAPDDKNRFTVTFFNSLKNANPSDPDQYWIYGFSAWYGRWVGKTSALNVGVEYFEDGSRRMRILQQDLGLDHRRAALVGGHAFWLGRVTFAQQLGVYVYDDYKVNDPVYQRYTLMCRVWKPVQVGMSLKAHRHVADFLDFRVSAVF